MDVSFDIFLLFSISFPIYQFFSMCSPYWFIYTEYTQLSTIFSNLSTVSLDAFCNEVCLAGISAPVTAFSRGQFASGIIKQWLWLYLLRLFVILSCFDVIMLQYHKFSCPFCWTKIDEIRFMGAEFCYTSWGCENSVWDLRRLYGTKLG